MVSFEELIKRLELRDILLWLLTDYIHPILLDISDEQIDMDWLQVYVYKNIPPFNWENFLTALGVSTVGWFVVFMTLHFLIIMPYMYIM